MLTALALQSADLNEGAIVEFVLEQGHFRALQSALQESLLKYD